MTNKKMTAPCVSVGTDTEQSFQNVVMILYPMFPQKSMKNF